ncbi:MAG: ABC transporter permease, partial [Longimicrobiales bacterium]
MSRLPARLPEPPPKRLPERPGPGERLYRALLLLYPRRFRSDFGPAMIDLFHVRRWQYLSEGGSFVALRFWTFVLRDLVGTALPERFGPLAARLFGSSEGEGAPRALVTKTRGLGMESMWGDVRYSIRRLVRTPGFSALAILIVALGIGVNSAMFSVLNAALFRPLPFKDAHELVEIYQDSDGGDPATNSYPAYLDMAAHTDLFQGVLAVKTWVGARQVDGVSELILTEFATSSYMAVLGLSPSLGRWFDTSEDVVGGPVVGVVSHRTWTAEGSDPDVLGSVVYIGGAPVTIIGVGPSGYNGMSPVVTVDFFLSISSSDPTGAGAATLTRRQDHHFLVKARLAPGVTAQAAQGGMDALAARLAEAYPELNRGRDITVLPSSSVRFHPLVDGLLLPAA